MWDAAASGPPAVIAQLGVLRACGGCHGAWQDSATPSHQHILPGCHLGPGRCRAHFQAALALRPVHNLYFLRVFHL
jgi:hypothetical protein